MSILGIENRTENWKTAKAFAPFFENYDARRRLAGRLLKPLDEPLGDGEVRLELFWKGVRDWMHKERWAKKSLEEKGRVRKEFTNIYNHRFPKMRDKVEKFRGFEKLQKFNYDGSQMYQVRYGDKLSNNLQNTEIDVVLQTTTHLFIGEAKYESNFGTNSNHVLVHQLIRQYVTATILLDLTSQTKRIVPFIISNKGNLCSVKNTAQVKFMLDQGWLKESNILSWECIDKVAKSSD